MLKYRFASIEDIKKVYDLSNDPTVRKKSENTNYISWDEHVNWFNKRILNKNLPFYIVEDENENFIGQVRFERKGEETIISISIVKEFRSLGLGSQIIKKSLKLSGFTNVSAYILTDNIPSINAFSKAGFKNSNLLKFKYTQNILNNARGWVITISNRFLNQLVA